MDSMYVKILVVVAILLQNELSVFVKRMAWMITRNVSTVCVGLLKKSYMMSILGVVRSEMWFAPFLISRLKLSYK